MPDQKVTVWWAEEERHVDMLVKDVTLVNTIPISKDLLLWASTGRSGEVPQDALQALDIILKEAVNLDVRFYNIGRQYFPLDGDTLDVGFGKEVWCGTFTQVRPYGWKDHEMGNFPGSGIRNKQVSDIESGYPDIESGYPDIRI